MHKVDVVIPTFNYGRFLDSCLTSVLEQTWGDFQVLVIDNASEDDTEALMHEWLKRDTRIRYERNPVNVGGARSVEKAYAMTSAPFVMTLCADDLLLPRFLEKVVGDGLDRHPECSFGYSLIHRMTERGLIPDVYQFVPRLPTGVHDLLYHFCLTNWLQVSFGVARRRHIEELRAHERYFRKFYAGSPRQGALGDHYQWLQLSTKGPAFVVNERQAIYRDHTGNDSHALGKATLTEESILIYDAVFYDKDIFPVDARYLCKINQIGRLLSRGGLAQAAVSMAQSGEIWPIVKDALPGLLEKLCAVVRDFRFDDCSGKLSHLVLESEANLEQLERIAAQLRAEAAAPRQPA